jgi:hypothetical protein
MRKIIRLAVGLALLGLFSNHPTAGQARDVVRAALPSTGGVSYTFTEYGQQGPLRWHTCGVVPVLVNPGPTGDAGVAEIKQALDVVGAHTGVKFRVVGVVAEVPRRTWARDGRVVDGWPYPAVLIAWVSGSQTDLITGGASGSAVANPSEYLGVRQIVSGAVALNSDQLDRFKPGFGSGSTRGNLILHELGHLVGLGHARGGELMSSKVDSSSPDGFTSGDLAGLRQLSPSCN